MMSRKIGILALAGCLVGCLAAFTPDRSPLDDHPAYERARAHIKAGGYAAAIPILHNLRAERPDSAEIFSQLGFAHRKLKDFVASRRFYDQALAMDPTHLGANEYLGEWFVEMGDLKAARERLSFCGAFAAPARRRRILPRRLRMPAGSEARQPARFPPSSAAGAPARFDRKGYGSMRRLCLAVCLALAVAVPAAGPSAVAQTTKLAPQRPGVVDAYILSFGLWGPQSVFESEAKGAAGILEAHSMRADVPSSGSTPRGGSLRSRATCSRQRRPQDAPSTPRRTWWCSSSRPMVRPRASDSWREGSPFSSHRRMSGRILDLTRARHRVLIVSACYSGIFARALADPRTLVITAAAPDKPSFGCRDGATWTYFGDAFFNKALRAEPASTRPSPARANS